MKVLSLFSGVGGVQFSIRTFFASVLVVVGSACSGGGAKVELVPVATELRPTPNGYAFANFPASASPEEFNADDLAKMFGSEACVDGVVAPCDPIAEAAAWARMVNQARASGQCEGMVVEASQRFDLSLSPPTVDLVNEGEVTHEIIRTFATQFLPEVQEETISWGEKSLAAIVAELVESFKTGKAKYSMGLYIEQGGHALLPYAVEFPTPDLAVIQLYDSNWPGKNRYVEVDLKAKQWRFSFSGKDPANDPAAWTGGQGFMDLTSLDTRGNSTCPFCASATKVKNSMIVISSVDTDWSISNANGSYSPGTNNLVEGIVSRPIRGSVSPNSVKLLEPLDGISTRMRIAGYGGLILALLVLLWILWRFIVPALRKKEKRYTTLFIVSSVALFVLGCSIAYWTLLKAKPNSSKAEPNSAKALEYVVFVEGNDMKLDLPNTTSAFISQGTAVVQVSTSGKNSGTVTFTKDTVSVDDPNVNVKVASADLVADIAGNNTVIGIAEKQLDVSVESSTGQTFTVAVNQETPQVSARAVDPAGSSAPTNFVITTQTSDNQVQVREVARDGSETVVTKQASAETDLNNTAIELVPALQVSTVKPGLPPLEDRDLKNPEYKADESFVPKTGLVVSKLAEVVVLNAPTTVPSKNTSAPEVMNSFGPTTLVPASSTTVPPSSTTTTPTTLPTTTTVKPTTTTKPVVRTTTTTTSTVPPTTTTSSTTTTTTSSTTTTTSTTTTVPPTTTTAPPIYSAPPDITTTTTTTSSTTTTTTTTSSTTTTTTLPDTSAPTVTLARTAATSSSASISFTVTGDEAIACSTLSLASDSDFALTNISTITSITQTSSTVCTIVAVSTATANGVGVVSTMTAAASFSIADTAGNAQTTLVGSPQSVTVTRNGEPDAPVISSVTAGNAQVVVAWSAPANNGAAISDYVVQYSTSLSGSYTAFADGISTSTSATVTGLTNGTAYYFKVAATNSVGTGSNSAASAAATPTLPTQTVTWSPTTALTTAQSPNTPLVASSSGDGAITYAVQSAGATGCAINSSSRQLTFSAAGSCVVRATAATTSNYLTGYIDATFTVTDPTCATGGACIVGDTGPGGGKVFYVHASGTFNCGVAFTSTCKYLEVAPSGWNTGADPTKLWAVVAHQSSDITTITNNSSAYNNALGIGLGYKNSVAIVDQGNGTTTAAGAARAYAGGSKSDWYLPTTAELNLLCQWARNVVQSVTTACTGGSLNTGTGASGGFSSYYYWSSSEHAATVAFFQDFSNGSQSTPYKFNQTHVRPVRAFG